MHRPQNACVHNGQVFQLLFASFIVWRYFTLAQYNQCIPLTDTIQYSTAFSGLLFNNSQHQHVNTFPREKKKKIIIIRQNSDSNANGQTWSICIQICNLKVFFQNQRLLNTGIDFMGSIHIAPIFLLQWFNCIFFPRSCVPLGLNQRSNIRKIMATFH